MVDLDREMLAAAQKRSMAAGRAWRDSAAHRDLDTLFDAAPAGDVDAVAGIAMHLLSQPDAVAALIAPLVEELAADPWFEPPLRVSRDSTRTGAIVFEHPAVSISASILSAAVLAARPSATSVAVPGRLTIVRYVRGGGARLRLWIAEPAGPDFSRLGALPLAWLGEVALTDGLVLRLDGRTRATRIEQAASDVVMLTATIRAATAPFQRDYALSTGELLRIATTDDAAARTQMLLTFLRHAGRADAGPQFDAATRDGAFFLRWAAMREWLGLVAYWLAGRTSALFPGPSG